MIFRQFLTFVTVAFLLTPFISNAQTSSGAPQEPAVAPPSGSTAAGSDGLESCFDYYHFGSTPIVITPDVSAVAQGGVVTFTGTITNNNKYPLTEVTLYVKIFHRNTTQKSSFGPDIVDWYVAKEHIVLKAGEVQPLSFTWVAPNNAELGSYSAAVFVAQNERFNLLGLSFTNDIVGASANFAVIGTNAGATRFGVSTIYVNNQQLHATAFSPRTDLSDGGVPISVDVINSSASAFSGKVHWKVYKWDGLQEKNIIAESSENVSVPAHATTTVRYSVIDSKHTVYYVIGELDPDDAHAAKSFINPRYVIGDAPEPRINFVGVTRYPASAGDTAVACMHSTGDSTAKNVTMKLFVEPHNPILKFLSFGTLSKSYSGDVSGKIRALTLPIQNKLPVSFDVHTKLYQDNTLIDEVTVPYVCSTLGAPCGFGDYIVWGTPVVLIILVILATVLFLRRKKVAQPPTSTLPQNNEPTI